MNTLWDNQDRGDRMRLRPTIKAKFESFHAQHPEVYDEFVRLSLELIAKGFKRHSADSLMHTVRYHCSVNHGHDSGFKINNNFIALYARKLMEEHPETFAGFFETRERKAV